MKRKLLATSALALLAATLPIAGSFVLTVDNRARAWSAAEAAIVGDDGDDEYGYGGLFEEYGDDDFFDDDGTLDENPDRADQGEIGEQGEYRDGEYGERGSAGWNPPPADHADESGELRDGLGEGGGAPPPSPNSGAPLSTVQARAAAVFWTDFCPSADLAPPLAVSRRHPIYRSQCATFRRIVAGMWRTIVHIREDSL